LVYNVLKHEEFKKFSLIRLDEEDFLTHLIHDLYKRSIQSVIVEGGAQTLQAFISAGLWDEACVFTSPEKFQRGVKAPSISGILESNIKLQNDWVRIITPGKVMK